MVFGMPTYLTYRYVRQEKLNRTLITAIKEQDTPAALKALQDGADANSGDINEVVQPWWKVMWDMMRGRRRPSGEKTNAIVLILQFRMSPQHVQLRPPEDSVLLKALLDHGADPNVHGEANLTPLLYCTQRGNVEKVRLLLDHGADPNIFNISYMSPLFFACGRVDKTLERLLLDHGANPNLKSANENLLVDSIAHKDIIDITLLLDHGANINAMGTGYRQTPLTEAIFDGDPLLVKLLIDRYADVNLVNSDGKSPLALAETSQYLKPVPAIIQMLKQAGAHR